MFSRIKTILAALVIAAAAFGGLAVALPSNQAAAAPSSEYTYPNLIVIANPNVSYAASYTTTGRKITNWTLMQVFSSLDVSDTQTVTVQLQCSPDNSTWFACMTVIGARSDDHTNAVTQTNATGYYVRGVVTAGTTNTFHANVQIVLK